MEKRFQVFVSSTYEDLREERSEVMQALLELDCIPSGMELFPAASESQWNFIKRIIDDCDYYMVVVAGRYGSLGPDGVGYTEMEYRYAESIGKPTIAFLHNDPDQLPANKTERSKEGQYLSQAFRSLLQTKLCKKWSSPAELGGVVSRSLFQMIKSHPGIGWVRGTDVSSEPDDNNIQITSPRPLEFLEDRQPLGEKGFSYRVRGTLKQRPRDHEIWLLTEHHLGGVFPQGFRQGRVQYDSQTGEWVGRVAVTTEQVKIIAVVAPPTSQDFFRYYQRLGDIHNNQFEKLVRVPPGCKNTDSVQAYCRLTD
jgi:Domain of unknown function (DUF4062)